ncbi:MAG TPA: hypothetical protein VGK40_13470, partial [Verrucomicrobiae bacterium]
KLLGPEQRLLEYPWSSFGMYLAARRHRPQWLRVDRLLGEHGIVEDTAAGRRLFEQQMEARRAERDDEAEWKPIRRGWCLGPAEFKARLLEQIEGKLGDHHSGELRLESAQAKGERIIGEELKGLKWSERDLRQRPKSDGAKLKLAARLRRETTLTIRQIAERLHLGSWKSLNNKLYLCSRGKGKPNEM